MYFIVVKVGSIDHGRVTSFNVLHCGPTIYAIFFATFCRRRQYIQGKKFIPATIYALERQYVPRVPAYISLLPAAECQLDCLNND